MPGGFRGLAVVLVVAVAENGVIGRGGGLPWRLKSDLRRFRSITIGHPVIMGRKTYLAIGKPLAGRTNILLTRDKAFAAAGIIVACDLEAALDIAAGDALRRGVGAIMVIGGADIYRQTLGTATRLDITRVHMEARGDALFPPLEPRDWRQIESRDCPAEPEDDAPFTITVYERVSSMSRNTGAAPMVEGAS